MGKKPFSAKAKREQLRAKRLASAASGGNNSSTIQRSNSKQSSQPSTTSTQPHLPSPSSTPTQPITQRQPRGRAPRGAHAHRFRLQLENGNYNSNNNNNNSNTLSSPTAAELAHSKINPIAVVETAINDIRPYPDQRFSMPRRPAWRYDESVSVVDKRENAALAAWSQRVAAGSDAPPYFERNLETWRQLWRVIERSDVIVLVVDIRYPALHFVPDLYYYVADDLSKGFVLALNKCDLVPISTLHAWNQYFKTTYPRLAVAMFSSFPDAKLSPSEHNSEMLSKRERRMARSKLSAWGADQLLAAVHSLDIDEKKKAFLEEWRAQLKDDASSDDEPSHDSSALNKPYVYGKDDEYLQYKRLNTRHRRKNAQRKRKRSNIPVDSDTSGIFLTSPNTKSNGSSNRDNSFSSRSKQQEKTQLEDGDQDDHDHENMITIGIVGHPNAGKSSLINGIFQKKVVSTSKTPGHTKHLQTIFLSDCVRLCDCPGLVFPGLAPRELQIIAGMYPIAQVREPLSVVKYLAERVRLVDILKLDSEVKKLEEFLLESDYVESGWTAWKICEAWAMKRGYRTAKAARLDVPRAANHILRLALDGRIVLSTVPKGFKVDINVESEFGGCSTATATCEDPNWSDEDTGADESSFVNDNDDINENDDENYDAEICQSLANVDVHRQRAHDRVSCTSTSSSDSSDSEVESENDVDDDNDDGEDVRNRGEGAAVNAFALLGEESE